MMGINHKKVNLFSLIVIVMLIGCSENPVQNQESDALSKFIISENFNTNSITAAWNPVIIKFDKAIAGDGIWVGTVSGDVEGELRTELRDVRESGQIWHVEFDWIITAGDDSKSFTARLNGILNNNTGKVVMNGTVIEGWLTGARVHEEGQLIDPETLQFEGTIQINTATSK
jgi:hypothetical protein